MTAADSTYDTSPDTNGPADIDFYFDPVCPFAWRTSKWIRLVQAQRDYTVHWRFISLRLINSAIDYDAHFPASYEAGHTAGLRLLRVAARTRAEHGHASTGPLYAAVGARIFDTASDPDPDHSDGGYRGTREFLEPALAEAGLPLELADALDDASYDAELRRGTDDALALTGKDVGTPIIQFHPPEGVAFFGPVISRLPTLEQAGPLWDNVIGLASFPGFAETQTQSAGTAAAAHLRHRPRAGRRPGGLARRQSPPDGVARDARFWR